MEAQMSNNKEHKQENKDGNKGVKELTESLSNVDLNDNNLLRAERLFINNSNDSSVSESSSEHELSLEVQNILRNAPELTEMARPPRLSRPHTVPPSSSSRRQNNNSSVQQDDDELLYRPLSPIPFEVPLDTYWSVSNNNYNGPYRVRRFRRICRAVNGLYKPYPSKYSPSTSGHHHSRSPHQ